MRVSVRRFSRPTVIAAGVLAATLSAAAVATPAGATGTPTNKHTAITLMASRATAAPRHKLTLTATLKSGRTALADESLCLATRTKTATASWGPWGTCMSIGTTDASGQAAVTGVVPRNGKGTKDEFKVFFAGATGYAPSHSAVITVTTS